MTRLWSWLRRVFRREYVHGETLGEYQRRVGGRPVEPLMLEPVIIEYEHPDGSRRMWWQERPRGKQ